MRTPTRPKRRIWPWIALAAVVIIVGIAVANTLRDAGVGTDDTTPTDTETTSAPPATTAPVEGVTGCLGGSIRNAAMVVAAQEQAPKSTDGAIEVATAFVRWLNQYPYPSAEDIAIIENGTFSADAPTTDLASFFATEPNLSGGLVADGQVYNLSSLPGVFHLESATENKVIASIGTGLVIDGQLNPTLKGAIEVTVSWEDGRWKFVKSQQTRSTEELFAIGLPFTAGC